jgi:hypothetical protein
VLVCQFVRRTLAVVVAVVVSLLVFGEAGLPIGFCGNQSCDCAAGARSCGQVCNYSSGNVSRTRLPFARATVTVLRRLKRLSVIRMFVFAVFGATLWGDVLMLW